MTFRRLKTRHISTKNQLEAFYQSLMPRITSIGKTHGYSMAVHGSRRRDLDVVAVPWTKDAHAPITLIRDIELKLLDYRFCPSDIRKVLTQKPHGRLAYAIVIGILSRRFRGKNSGSRQTHAYIDLSIMPRT